MCETWVMYIMLDGAGWGAYDVKSIEVVSLAKYDWVNIKNEYLTTSISMKNLAEKHSIPFDTIRSRAKTEKWAKQQKENHSIITQKSLNKMNKKVVDRNTRHLEIYDNALDAIEKIIKEELKIGVDMFGNQFRSPVIIHSKLARVIEALEKVQSGHRLAEGLISALDDKKLDIEERKLQLAEKKLGNDDDNEIIDNGFVEALRLKKRAVEDDE